MNFFESPELDFAQAPQSVRDRSVLIFYTQNFKREVMAHAIEVKGRRVRISTIRYSEMKFKSPVFPDFNEK